MTISKILDTILPYTKEELRCGFKKQKKSVLRIKFAEMLNDHFEGNSVNWASILDNNSIQKLTQIIG